MRDIRIAIHGQPARRAGAVESGCVEGEPGHVYDIAFAGDDDALALDGIADLTCHNEPELGTFGVVVSPVRWIERRQILLVTVDEVRRSSIILHNPLGPGQAL